MASTDRTFAQGGISVVFSAEIFSRMLSFLTFIYLARVLDPSTLGKVGVASSAVAFLVPLAELGFSIPAGRLMSQDAGRFRHLLQISLTPKLLAAAVAAGLVALGATFVVDPVLRWLMLLNALFIPIGTWSLVWAAQAGKARRSLALERIVQTGLYGIGVLLFVKSDHDVLIQPVAMVLSALAGQCVLALGLRPYWRRSSQRVAEDTELLTWRESTKFLQGAYPVTMFVHIAVVIGGLMLSMSEMGYVTLAARLLLVGMSFTPLAGALLFPDMIQELTKVPLERSGTRKSGWIVAGAITAAAVGATLFGREITWLLGGDAYLRATPLVIVMIGTLGLQTLQSTMVRVSVSSGDEPSVGRALFRAAMPVYVALPVLLWTLDVNGFALSILLLELSVLSAFAWAGALKQRRQLVEWAAMTLPWFWPILCGVCCMACATAFHASTIVAAIAMATAAGVAAVVRPPWRQVEI